MARLMKKFYSEIVPAMKQKLGYTNDLAVPRLEKIVVNMGVGRALENKKRLEHAVRDLMLLSGQRPVVTKAKTSVAGFKLREDQEIGCKVTLRRIMMYEFLDRMISVAIPRIRDFRGINPKSFDGAGNYSLGISDLSIFPEIHLDSIEFYQGMDVIMVIKNGDIKSSFELLKLFGMPFRAEA